MKKRIVMKKWFEKVVMTITAIALMFIATTIDSEWTTPYLIALAINFALFIGGALLIINFGRNEED